MMRAGALLTVCSMLAGCVSGAASGATFGAADDSQNLAQASSMQVGFTRGRSFCIVTPVLNQIAAAL